MWELMGSWGKYKNRGYSYPCKIKIRSTSGSRRPEHDEHKIPCSRGRKREKRVKRRGKNILAKGALKFASFFEETKDLCVGARGEMFRTCLLAKVFSAGVCCGVTLGT